MRSARGADAAHRLAQREGEAPDRAARDAFAADVRTGLSGPAPKRLPPRWLYDDVGSALFEAISCLPEYGLTRADARVLEGAAGDIAEQAGRPSIVVELGSGNGRKARPILQALARRDAYVRYHPVDVSGAALAAASSEYAGMPGVRIEPQLGTFIEGLADSVIRRSRGERILVLFLGSTIGNLDTAEAHALLRAIRAELDVGDALLVGADLIKPVATMLTAYDDPAGVTAAFNRNLLCRMNRELGANFDLAHFQHRARWNAALRHIEMHLQADSEQQVAIPGADLRVRFDALETIWTESSCKYREGEIAELGRLTGWHAVAEWTDREWPFTETLLSAAA